MSNCAVIIPALNPDPSLLSFVQDLLAQNIPWVIVVNDGSRQECLPLFSALANQKGCIVLTHSENKGKGRALKDAFIYVSENLPQVDGVVTADADGQHSVKDICHIANLLQGSNSPIFLGTRDFRKANVPIRSLWGNTVTSILFKLLYGCYLKDTQTGLRGFPTSHLAWLIKVAGERFDYEMNVLIQARHHHATFQQVAIDTIYYQNNKGSHYSSFQDSMRIFGRLLSGLLQYSFSSALSAIVDVLLFLLCNMVLFRDFAMADRLFWSTFIARVISSMFNYSMNRTLVFQHGGKVKQTLFRYYLLWAGQLLASYGLVYAGSTLFAFSDPLLKNSLLKIIIDLGLAIVSYQIQLHWVFRQEHTKEEDVTQ